VGGQATNEEGFLVQHLMRSGLGARDIAVGGARGPSSAAPLARALARLNMSARVSDIDHADAILVLDTELVDEAPILDLRVRKAVRRNGARLVVASSRPSTLDGAASAALRFAPGADEAALGALATALGSRRAGELSLDDLARSARAEQGFIPGRTNGHRASGPESIGAVADVLRDAGDVVVIWGERALAGRRGAQAGQALLAVADALGIGDKPESGLIGIPAETNGRGLREVGCAAGMGPGFSEADALSGDGSGALLLFEADASEPDAAAAGGVVAFASFLSESLEEQADVVFPAPVYAEKEGTITHPDGRVQRVRQALGHAGESRAGWWVLEELCQLLGAGTGALSSAAVTALVADAVPFYSGLTLDEIGGEGVRWQDRDAASAAPSEALPDDRLEQPPAAPEGMILAGAPSLWAGPEVSHSPSLRFLDTGPLVLISPADARELGVHDGELADVHANGDSVQATVVVRTGVPAGSIFLSPLTLAEGPAEVRTREAVAG